MSKKAFLVVADAATVTFDFDLSKSQQVTLGGNRTAVFTGGQEGDVAVVKIIQDGTGSRTLTWDSDVTWPSGAAPTLKTAASAVDLFVFQREPSGVWRCISGDGGSRLPSRIMAAVLGTIVGIGIASGGAVITVKLSGGSGAPTEIGRVADVKQVIVGTGGSTTMTYRQEGSGAIMLSSSGSGLGIGVPNLKATSEVTDANAYVTPQGAVVTKSTYSGAAMTLNKATAGSGHITGHGADGFYICLRDSDNVGWTVLEVNNGVAYFHGAPADVCP